LTGPLARRRNANSAAKAERGDFSEAGSARRRRDLLLGEFLDRIGRRFGMVNSRADQGEKVFAVEFLSVEQFAGDGIEGLAMAVKQLNCTLG
jgi:hypothetical protein